MKIWNSLLNLFFPNLCLLCKTPLVKGEEYICLHCLCNLSRTHYEQYTNNVVDQLFFGKVNIKRATAWLRFKKEGNTQQLIHNLKYKGNKELGYYLGRLAALEIKASGLFDTVDILVPVPLHPRKKRKRGYNQTEWIARGMNSVLNKTIDTTTLQRIQVTKTQTRKNIYERWTNVQDAFAVKQSKHFTNKHILIIDDVITTGSTLSACAQVILTASKTHISLFSLAIAER